MSDRYRIFGSEMSPYSVKVRSYCRYKGIAHEWVPRGPWNDEEFRRYARLPIVPTVVTPAGEGIQDSTPIIELLEERFPEPSIHPPARHLAFLSALLEEFGDEWGNKLMFHHRWHGAVDRAAASLVLARLGLPRGSDEEVAERAKAVSERMAGRGGFVGSSERTAPLISAYFGELLELLEPHLATRPYLFGARPSFADFGLFAQLYQASMDPTGSGLIRARAGAVLEWCHRMLAPRSDGPFETWAALEATMMPLLAHVGRYFLPWSAANARALDAGAAEFSVELPGGAYVQAPQKYHAKSLVELRRKYAAVADDAELRRLLDETGCTPFLAI